jgi:hypothetical protein
MKIGILHVNKASFTSTSPTMRIAKYVANQLPEAAFIYDVPTAAAVSDVVFDVLFVKYGMLAFSDHRKDALKIYANAKRVINLENDYTFTPDKRFRPADEVWSTVEGRTCYVNWNVLTRHGTGGWEKPEAFRPVTNKGILYYGAHRPDRIPYFEKYLRSNAPYPVTVSSFRGKDTFGVTCNVGSRSINIRPAFRDPDEPAEWEMTVYMEDTASHDLYCSPANRFYECVHMGLAQAIDEAAADTLKKAGIPKVESFVVDSAMKVRSLLTKWEDVRHLQQKLWRRDYSADLHEQFRRAMKESRI